MQHVDWLVASALCFRKVKSKSDVNNAVHFSVTPSPAAQRTSPATETRMRMTLPRCRQPRRTRARRAATALLLLTPWLLGACRERGPVFSQPLQLSGAWRKCAGSSPHFKVGVSSLSHVFCLLCRLCSPSTWSFFFFLLRLWRVGRPLPVAGNWRSSSPAAARGPPHLHHEHQAGSRPQDLCLHQHTTWVIKKIRSLIVFEFSVVKKKITEKLGLLFSSKKKTPQCLWECFDVSWRHSRGEIDRLHPGHRMRGGLYWTCYCTSDLWLWVKAFWLKLCRCSSLLSSLLALLAAFVETVETKEPLPSRRISNGALTSMVFV